MQIPKRRINRINRTGANPAVAGEAGDLLDFWRSRQPDAVPQLEQIATLAQQCSPLETDVRMAMRGGLLDSQHRRTGATAGQNGRG